MDNRGEPSCLTDLSFWENFSANIRAQNEFVAPRRLMRFQEEILSSGRLIVTSPFDGRSVEAETSRYLPGGFVCYGFRSLQDFWIVSYSIRHGFPLSRIVIQGDWSIYDIEGQKRTLAGEDLLLSRQINLLKVAPDWSGKTTGPLLLLGHPNFAHHLWNELSGLDAWLKRISSEVPGNLSINCQFEPLGAIETLFPELDKQNFVKGGFIVENRSAGSLITHIGSTLITTAVRTRIVDAMSSDPNEITNAILSKISNSRPILWITVRPPNTGRACLNQSEFLSSVVTRLYTEFPQSSYIFDGFSTPIRDKESSDFTHLSESFNSRIISSRDIISKVIDSVAADLGSIDKNRFIDVTGLDIRQAVMIAKHADYYVSHAGTIQHKLGWIHNTPGFIHSCQSGITASARRWYADQVEDGKVPNIISARFVEDATLKEGIADRNVDYTITNVDEAVDSIVDSIFTELKLERRLD